ncbi:unnamed protein product [Peniophora sp. CBMAI 1063]|nr:unnamed protein product [Peniophora sp. CBMAI 1063]
MDVEDNTPESTGIWAEAVSKFMRTTRFVLNDENCTLYQGLGDCTEFQGTADALIDTLQTLVDFPFRPNEWMPSVIRREIGFPIIQLVRIVLEKEIGNGKDVLMAIGGFLTQVVASQWYCRRSRLVTKLLIHMSECLARPGVQTGSPVLELAMEPFVDLLDVLAIATIMVRENQYEEFAEALLSVMEE